MRLFLVAGALVAMLAPQSAAPQVTFDVIVRHGTVLDGSGRARYDADLGIRGGIIAAIGDLGTATAPVDIDARGLYVAPGFINIHSHASANALPTAVNMLTQGVTTEIVNADGGGPIDLGRQMTAFGAAKLAVNIGGYIGFNSAWQSVVGAADRRPTTDEIERMRALIRTGLEQGAWGVSAGLDYKPAYFAKIEDVISIVDVARPWRTNFTNHDRLAPESNFSSRVGVSETITIAAEAGLVPVVTHMKVQGHEQGTAGAILESMTSATARGVHTAADAYPYLAGQSGLGALIVPGWAQEGGRAAMLARFADPETRERIVKEAEQAMTLRFGGPSGVYLPRTQQELAAVMKEMNAGAGETVLRLIEQGDPGAILRFGAEADLIKILQHPTTSMACDCGASTAERMHPRFYGSHPRLLGRYIREQQIMSWEEAIRKSSGLPASTIGMVDRGTIALGMAADIAVFDPKTIIDHATYDEPSLPSVGMRFVLVNGQVALSEGRATGAQGGRVLTRTANMPSRAMHVASARQLTVVGVADGRRVAIDLTQSASDRAAKGSLTIEGPAANDAITFTAFGELQTSAGWATVTGFATSPPAGDTRAAVVVIDQKDPAAAGATTVVIMRDGATLWRGTLPSPGVTIK